MRNKFARFLLKKCVVVFCILLISANFVAHAQGEPTSIIDAAYTDLSQKLGVVIISTGTPQRPTTYSWTNQIYTDASLDCPATGMVYTKGDVVAYQITIKYLGNTYDYRAKADGSLIFECSANLRAPGGQLSVAPTQPPAPVSNTGNPSNSGGTAPTITGAPLLLAINGDTWAWNSANSAPKQWTTWGYNQPGIMSPNGLYIAYASSAQFAVDMIKAKQLTHTNTDPTNIWLLEIANSGTRRLADQPAGTSMSGTYMIRSQPAWSPDSRSLAWTEVTVSADAVTSFQLMTLAIDAATPAVLARFSPEVVNLKSYVPAPVRWGRQGVAVLIPTAPDGNQMMAFVLDLKGNALLKSEPLQGMAGLEWISDGAQEAIAVVPADQNARWKVLDQSTGKASDLAGTPELYSLSATTGLTISPIYSPTAGGQTIWGINSASGGNTVVLHDLGNAFSPFYGMAISADGAHIAYITSYNVVLVSASGESSVVSSQGLSGLVWGPTGWRVRKA